MEFDDDLKIKIESMTEAEARAFILFLRTEIIRHCWDIRETKERIKEVKERFGI